MKLVTTFAQRAEFERARGLVESLSLPYEVVWPEPGYALVGAPALVMGSEARMALAASGLEDFVAAGWVRYDPPAAPGVTQQPLQYDEDVFGRAAVMVLASCTADESKIRVIAHISGDLSPVFPYLNAVMPRAFFNPNGPTLTFMDGYRMVTAYARRVAVAKADDIVDAWRVLEGVRRRANDTWARRAELGPSYEVRTKPPALEIYKRLPGTNCGACGERTCLAFAVAVHGGHLAVRQCAPVFGGEFAHLKDALLEICSGLGVGISSLTPTEADR